MAFMWARGVSSRTTLIPVYLSPGKKYPSQQELPSTALAIAHSVFP
jgi:hypothetical protein